MRENVLTAMYIRDFLDTTAIFTKLIRKEKIKPQQFVKEYCWSYIRFVTIWIENIIRNIGDCQRQ